MLDAFDLSKHTEETNIMDRIHLIPFVQYARVVEIINNTTVNAETIIRTALSRQIYTITLLSLSSELMEIKVVPRIGDTVLILFLQHFNPAMFTTKETIHDPFATGYNSSSGIGILMSTAKAMAKNVLTVNEESTTLNVLNNMDAYFDKSVNIEFREALALLLGPNSPIELLSRSGISVEVKENIGISTESDINLQAESDINLQAESDINLQAESDINIKSTQSGLLELGNAVDTLGGILTELIDIIADLDTAGSPSNHKTAPPSVLKLQLLQQTLDQVFK